MTRRVLFTGAFRERLHASWTEIRENLGRATLQTLGIILGVASVVGGFSINDSFSRQSDKLFVKMGGLDKLNVQPAGVIKDGAPSALQMANLGLRALDSQEGGEVDAKAVQGVSILRSARARVRSPFADQDRQITGAGIDSASLEGYRLDQGRLLSAEDLASATPVAILGSEAAATFFPSGNALGQTLTLGDKPVKVVGLVRERVFRFREGQRNIFRRQNRMIAVPATFVQRRLQGDQYQRLDRVVFRIPDLNVMQKFSQGLTEILKGNHRQQEDFRLDDVQKRIRRQQSQGDAYNIIFMLSGVLALVGGGIVNVNIQMAGLRERVREVGVKMAIGASSVEIFKEFMTEAMLLSTLGGLTGLLVGLAFSRIITWSLKIPLFVNPLSFLWALLLAGLTGFLFALYPAWKASRQSPMEALRYE
jgi:putative ABC transport system permease protein